MRDRESVMMKQHGSVLGSVRRATAVGLSFVLAAVLGVTAVVPANAADTAATAPAKPQITSVAGGVSYDARDRVPVVESMLGRGTIPTDETGAVAVSGLQGYDSVLARVSVFDAERDATIYAAGVPSLDVVKGHDASQSVLVPIKDGKLPLRASSAVKARVEVLSAFKGDPSTPGATNVLSVPVVRADSAKRLGVEDPRGASTFGVTGLGGVPTKNVRAVWVTVHVSASKAGEFAIGEQKIGIFEGESSVSTVVVPDKDGNIGFRGFPALGTVSVAVRGWVTGTDQNKEYANVPGSYVPSSDSAWHGAKNGSVHVGNVAGTKLGLALVSVSPSGRRSFVDAGRPIKGRSAGVLVDGKLGAVPQIEVVENGGREVPIGVRGKTSSVKVLLLGDVLADQPAAVGRTKITFDSPRQGADVDFMKGGWLLEGRVSSDAAIRSVDIYGNGKKVATASVQYTGDGVKWSFWGGWPESGKVRYEVKAVSADGSTATESKTVRVTLPDPNASILSRDVVRISEKNTPVASVNDDSVIFSQKPDFAVGRIISSGITKTAPNGFLRWVDAIERTGDEWRVTTHQAALADAILQGSTGPNRSSDSGHTGTEASMRSRGSASPAVMPASAPTGSVKLAKAAGKTAQDLDWVEKDDRDLKVMATVVPVECVFDDIDSNPCEKADDGKIGAGKKSDGKADGPKIEGEGSFTLRGSINFGFLFGFSIKMDPGVNIKNIVDYIKAEANTTAELSLSASVSTKIKKEWEIPIYSQVMQPIEIPTPIVIPIVVVPRVDVSLEPSVEVSASATWSTGLKNQAQAGALRDLSQMRDWQPYRHVSTGNNGDDSGEKCINISDGAELAFSATASLGIKGAPKLMLWGVAGPQVDLTPELTLSVEGKANNKKLTIETTAENKIKAAITFVAEIPDFVTKKISWLKNDPQLSFKSPELTMLGSQSILPSKEIPFCNPDPDKPDPDKPGGQKPAVTWTPPSKSTDPTIPTDSVPDTHKPGDTIELTQKYLEDLFGVPEGTFKDLIGVNTQADGKGKSYAIGGQFVVPAKAVTLYLQFKQKEPDSKKAKFIIVIDGKAYVVELPIGSKFTLTAENLEKLLGLNKGELKDLYGLNTAEDGTGRSFKLNDVITIPEGGLRLFVRYSPASDFTNIKQVVGDYALDDKGYVWLMGKQTEVGVVGSSVVSLFTQNIDKLYGGIDTMFAVDKNGGLWVWGDNMRGEIPDMQIDHNQALPDYHFPTQIHGLPKLKDIQFGLTGINATVFLLGEDGSVWVWGDNTFGQFGDGTQTSSQKPRKIAGLPEIKQVAHYLDATAALGTDGSVWVWGSGQGYLGDGNQHSYSLKPTQIRDIPQMRYLVVSRHGINTLDGNGQIWNWGNGGYLTPTISNSLAYDSFSRIYSASGNMYAFTDSGDLYISSTDTSLKKVDDLPSVKQFISTYSGGMVLGTDGSVHIWDSSNSDGIIGDGTTNPSLVPKGNSVLHDVKDIGYGYAIENDGTLWLWSTAREYYENYAAHSLDDVHETAGYMPVRYGALAGTCRPATITDLPGSVDGFSSYACPVNISKK